MTLAHVVITGGDGYVGAALAAALLGRGVDRIDLLVRARTDEEVRRKSATLPEAVTRDARVAVLPWDVASPAPPPVDTASVRTIVHAAAVTRFSVDRPTAERVNVQGTRRVVELAATCPALERLTVLSTVYSSGLVPGARVEAPNPRSEGFANHYEWSKAESERVALASSRLPLQIARLGTIIADDDDGRVGQLNAFHTTMRLLFAGLLPIMPGDPATPMYFLTLRFATEALARLLTDGGPGIYHVAHAHGESLTLDRLFDVAFERFGAVPEFRRRRVLPPLYVDLETFEKARRGVTGFAGELVVAALESLAPFAAQLYVRKEVRNDRVRSVLPDYRAPDPEALVGAVCDALVASRWGRDGPPPRVVR